MKDITYEGWVEVEEHSPFNVNLKPINKPWYQNIF